MDGKKSKNGKHRTSSRIPITTDERFVHAANDPIFRRVPKAERKVTIDKRFNSMFHDKNFKLKYQIDKRGRPIDLSSDENLKKYYNLEEDDDEVKEETSSSDSESDNEGQKIPGNITESEIVIKHKSKSELSKTARKKLHNAKVDYARGEGIFKEDSSDSSSTDDEDEVDTSHAWGELDHDAERNDEISHRLALCNMDWDRLRAMDLMVLFSSFVPTDGLLKSVSIYTSEFGKERLKDEEVHGPLELRELKKEKQDFESDEEEQLLPKISNADDEEEGDHYQMEKLRQYQLNRLKYFYAVLEFDSEKTAEVIYEECDGMEYESSATKIDLRYIPDEMTFDEEPTDFCDALPQADKYRPRFFTTTALQQAKVELTWDETDPLRQELTEKIHNPKEKIDDEDIRAYLASSSGSEGEDEIDGDPAIESNEDPVAKYKALLESIESEEKKKKDDDVEMEITWGVGLKQKSEEIVKKKLQQEKASQLTPWEEMLEKRKQKKKEKKIQKHISHNDTEDQPFSDDDVNVDMNDPYFRDAFLDDNEICKAKIKGSNKKGENKVSKLKDQDAAPDTEKSELELLLMDEKDDNKHHFSLKKIIEAENENNSKKKKKRKMKKESTDSKVLKDDFEIDVNDERFRSLFTSHLYNVDPSDPNYKKTRAMQAITSEKQKRRKTKDTSLKEDDERLISDDKLTVESEKQSSTSTYLQLVKSIKRNTTLNLNKNSKKKKMSSREIS